MFRILTIIWAIACAASASARNEWFPPPVPVNAGLTVVDTVPPNVSRADVHVRVQRCSKGACSWQLHWNCKDEKNYAYAQVSLPDVRGYDNLYTPEATVDVIEVRDGMQTPVISDNIPLSGEALSLKIVYDGFSARLYAGVREKSLVGVVPFDAREGGEVMLRTQDPLLVERITAECFVLPEPKYGSEVHSAAVKNAGPILGQWQYLDREIDANQAMLGGKYRIAIAPGSGGSYEIIYLGGATVNAEDWNAPRLKGILRPSGFQNNYDLEWYDAAGRLLDDDNNAQLSDDGAILTLRFPVYKSQLRFRRSR